MELELKDYIRVIRKRIWVLIILMICSGAIASIYSYFIITPTYQASSKLIVNKTTETTVSSKGEQITLGDINLNISLINTYKEIIRTTKIMNIVAERNPDFGLTGTQLIQMVKVNSVNNTQVMTVSVIDDSNARAVKIVNAISETFKNEIPYIYKVDNVSILDMAKESPNAKPIKPQPLLNITIGLILGLMIAVGLILLLEYLDDTIKTEEDITNYMGLPTLAMITTFTDGEESKKRNRSSQSRGVSKVDGGSKLQVNDDHS